MRIKRFVVRLRGVRRGRRLPARLRAWADRRYAAHRLGYIDGFQRNRRVF